MQHDATGKVLHFTSNKTTCFKQDTRTPAPLSHEIKRIDTIFFLKKENRRKNSPPQETPVAVIFSSKLFQQPSFTIFFS